MGRKIVFKRKPEKRSRNSGVWKEDYYYIIYDLVLKGYSKARICRELGIGRNTLISWQNRKANPSGEVLERLFEYGNRMKDIRNKELEKEREEWEATVKEKKEKGGTESFFDFVYGRLPSHLKELWEEMRKLETVGNQEGKRLMLREVGVRARQQLFLYAYVGSNFNVTKACRKLEMRRSQFYYWIENDKGFGELMQEIMEAKKDFFESHLIKKIKEGDTKAIIFANKTLNRDRGYSEKIEVEHTGKVEHVHNHHIINLDEIYLPIEIRKRVLEAVRNHRMRLEDKSDEIEGEFEKVEDKKETLEDVLEQVTPIPEEEVPEEDEEEAAISLDELAGPLPDEEFVEESINNI